MPYTHSRFSNAKLLKPTPSTQMRHECRCGKRYEDYYKRVDCERSHRKSRKRLHKKADKGVWGHGSSE